MRSNAGLVLGIVTLCGCVHPIELRPAVNALPSPAQQGTAMAEASGLRVTVLGRWDGQPSDLWEIVTPVRVTIENHSGAPVAIRYKGFALVTSTGFRGYAVPPFQVQRPGVVVPSYPYSGFFIAPPFSPWFPSYPLWNQPFDFDMLYFDSHYQWQEALPTPDMLAKALPVGVLANDGTVTGYLYFQKLAQGIDSVTFTADFVDASNGSPVGTISIPLLVTNNGK